MQIHMRSFAVGLLCAFVLLGCMMAVTNVNTSAGARYEVHWSGVNVSNPDYVVLDTQTGTTVVWGASPSGEIRPFNAAQ